MGWVAFFSPYIHNPSDYDFRAALRILSGKSAKS